MKTIALIITMAGILSFYSYGQKDVDKLLKNQDKRTEIFNAIQNDNQFMTEFMENMHGNENAMMMWRNNNMMGQQEHMGMNRQYHMMDQNAMMNVMHNNPEMMQTMIDNMIKVCSTDSVMSRKLVNGMSQYPQMMQMMKHSINQKGMMGTEGEMPMNNSEGHKMDMGHPNMH